MNKVLFNCTINNVGGGVKNSAIFIKFVTDKPSGFYWYFIVSPAVKQLLDKWNVQSDNIYVLQKSPAKSLRSRKELRALELKLQVDCVYTMAGPAYVKFKSPHILGISNPYITHVKMFDLLSFQNTPQVCATMLSTCYRAYYARLASAFVFQTESSRLGFSRRLFIPKCKTKVIPNAFDGEVNFKNTNNLSDAIRRKVLILCPGADYAHKGFILLPKIAFYLKKLMREDFEFRLTLSPDSKLLKEILELSKKLGVENEVVNFGEYSYNDVATVYKQHHIVLVPSLLETFSATYLEAFSMNRPLIVADREFSKDVCGDAALYIEPLEPQSSAQDIFDFISCQKSKSVKVKKGIEQLEKFSDHEIRTNSIIDFIKKVVSE